MEPTDPAQLHQKLGQQDAIREFQQQQLHVQTMIHQMADLSTSVRAVPPIFAPSSTSAAPPDLGPVSPPTCPVPGFHEPRFHEPCLPPPERYNGEPGSCWSFLTQCQLLFSLQPPSPLRWRTSSPNSPVRQGGGERLPGMQDCPALNHRRDSGTESELMIVDRSRLTTESWPACTAEGPDTSLPSIW